MIYATPNADPRVKRGCWGGRRNGAGYMVPYAPTTALGRRHFAPLRSLLFGEGAGRKGHYHINRRTLWSPISALSSSVLST